MTEYSQKLIEFFTKNGRKPVFIEKYFDITPETPLEYILYTYNEMPCRGYLIEEQEYFLENAQQYSGKDSFCFLYPSVMLDVPFEKHPDVIAHEKLIKECKKLVENLLKKSLKKSLNLEIIRRKTC